MPLRPLQIECEAPWRVWPDIVSKSSHPALAILFALRQFEPKNIKPNITHYSRTKTSRVLKITSRRDSRYWCFSCEPPITKHDKDKTTHEKYPHIDSSRINNKHNERSIMQFKYRSEILSRKNKMRNSAMYSISLKM